MVINKQLSIVFKNKILFGNANIKNNFLGLFSIKVPYIYV